VSPPRLELLDGTPVRVRPVRPEDREEFVAAFDRLSADSRYTRFLSPVERLTEREIDYFLDVDHRDHEALVVTREGSGERLGIGRYVRLAEREEAAEVAITVADAWQHRGVGTVLLAALARRALANDVYVFTAEMLASNHAMRSLFDQLGGVTFTPIGDGVVFAEAEL
jgi:GNAT superfamily N-acetyltransferase